MKFKFINKRGDILPLSYNPLFALTNIDGQTAGEADLKTTETGYTDGDTITNAKALARIVVIDLRIRQGVDVETAKREILKIVKLYQQVELVWEQGERTVVITGTVEAIGMPRWTNETLMQITLHCSQPFWEDVDEIVQQISEAINLHYFTDGDNGMLYFPEDGIAFGEYDTIRTKSFYNDGDVSVGLEITILAHDTVTNPIIYDHNNNYFGLGTAEKPFIMKSGDNVVITTHINNKYVYHNGVNIYHRIKPNSTWLQLGTGDSQFSINSDDDNIQNMSFSLVYKQRYI